VSTKPNQTRTRVNNGAVKPLDEPTPRNQIQKRAHEIWLSIGCSHGHDVARWLQVENEVLAEHHKNANQKP
jgi:hypothetical protein